MHIDLDSNTHPLHREDTTKFIALLSHMMKGFRNFDPAVKKKLTVHPDLPTWACKNGYSRVNSPQRQATGDLILIAFYYLL